MKPRANLALLAVLASAPLMVACDSATAPRSSLQAAGSVSSNKISDGDKDACKNGGFANYLRDDGSAFSNQGECVSYVEHGGQLMPKEPPPAITSFSANTAVTNGVFDAKVLAVFTGGTGTVSSPSGTVTVTSGVAVFLPTDPSFPTTFRLTVTNAAGATATATATVEASGNDVDRRPGGSGRIGGGSSGGKS